MTFLRRAESSGRLARRVGVWAGLLAITWALHLLGRGRLAAPAWSDPAQLAQWWRHDGTLVATFSLLRVGVVAIGVYLIGFGALGLLWRVTRWRTLFRVLTWVAVPGLRAALLAGIGISGIALPLAAAATVPKASPALGPSGRAGVTTSAQNPSPPQTPVMHFLEPTSAVSNPTAPGVAPLAPPVLRPLGPTSSPGATPVSSPTTSGAPPTSSPTSSPTTRAAPLTDSPTTDAPSPTAVPASTVAPPPPSGGPHPGSSSTTNPPAAAPASHPSRQPTGTPAPGNEHSRPPQHATATTHSPVGRRSSQGPTTPAAAPGARAISHTVVAGDSLWSIARHRLSDARGEPPGPQVLAHYWWQVVELNRPHLSDPDNPDLLFPGEVVQLPPLPSTVESN